MTNKVLSGSCLCGAVRFEVRQPYLRFAHCYCSRCRKATGSSHATNLYVAPPQFSWVSGEAETKRFDLPTAASFATTHCKTCGSKLPHFTRSGREVVVTVGEREFDAAYLQSLRELGQGTRISNPARGYWLGVAIDPKTGARRAGIMREFPQLAGGAVGY